jgi:hypothetical protein
MKTIYALFIISCLFLACNYEIEEAAADVVREKKWTEIKKYIREGENISDERPIPDVASEKEALIHAADVLLKSGYLNPDCYIFQDDPRLLTANIEKPLLAYALYGPGGKGKVWYYLTATADNGQLLIEYPVNPIAGVSDSELLRPGGYLGGARYDPINNDAASYHYITEREAAYLIETVFPGREYEGPVLLYIQPKSMAPLYGTDFWYFVLDDGEEYVIARFVTGLNGWNNIEGGIANHEAISKPGNGGSGFLGGERMARISPKLRFFDLLRENKDVLAYDNIPFPPNIAFDFEPIPLPPSSAPPAILEHRSASSSTGYAAWY